MRAEAHAYDSHIAGQPRVAFGFPKVSGPGPPIYRFGWDYAATHRIGGLPTGGIVLMISDRCVIVFAPFPLIGCALGKIKSKGNLFEHMGDPRDLASEALP